ncbi:hypothetical protein FHS39_001105 [Streptomyces olivoverticillatus]|uniref:DUF7847 domain-containing protein n=1 Tax=Streptomyces olivoverticillatus TaxID=66427 RepID=A0A7W7LL86_9ACTN|nr:hypothetical protein [Streptomyces olivoverticillatus]MBB4892094.1 hypothetical protein [Streptomyces olivoverticillatus]
MNDSPGWNRARADSSGGQGGWNNPQGGWGGPQWIPPQPLAPQPGVIPLRPLRLGEILDGAINTTRKYWRPALGVSLAVAAVTQTAATLVTGLWFRDATGLESLKDPATPREVLHAFKDSMSSLALAGVVGFVGSIIAAGVLTIVVSRAVLGREVTTREAWRDTRPRLGQMAGLFCLLPLLLGAILAAGMAPGLALFAAGSEEAGAPVLALGGMAGIVAAAWLWIRYSLAAPALMLEKQGVFASLRRSAKLVRGTWWRIFGIQILAALLVSMVSAAIQTPLSLFGPVVTGTNTAASSMSWHSLIIAGIGDTIASTITLPFTAGVTALLYMDQRIRRESLDLELARAAGNE